MDSIMRWGRKSTGLLCILALWTGCKPGSQLTAEGQAAGDVDSAAGASQTGTSAGMQGPGTFAREITKEDFHLGPSVTDLIWMDQVNGVITKDAAVYQYLCHLLHVEPSCLDPQYADAADSDAKEMEFEWDDRTLGIFLSALSDPEVSDSGKAFIQQLFFLPQDNPSAKKQVLAGTSKDVLPEGLTNWGKLGEVISELNKLKNSGSVLEAHTLSNKKIKIYYDPAENSASVAETIKATLESSADPWQQYHDLFGVEALSLDEDSDMSYYLTSALDMSKNTCYSRLVSSLYPGKSRIYIALHDMGNRSQDYPRGHWELPSDKGIAATTVHELYHAFSCNFIATQHKIGDPLEEAHAKVAEDMIFPENGAEHLFAKWWFLDNKRSAGLFIHPPEGRYPSYLWMYYLSRVEGGYRILKDYLDHTTSQKDLTDWLEIEAKKNNRWLGFAASLLNLNREFLDQGVLSFGQHDADHQYQSFMLASPLSWGTFLPGKTPSDKVKFALPLLNPFSMQYIPFVALDDANHGTYACYDLETDFPAGAQLGLMWIDTDDSQRQNYQVLDWNPLDNASSETFCFPDPQKRPDAMILVFVNPTQTVIPKGGKLTLSARPFDGPVIIRHTVSVFSREETTHDGGGSKTENVTFEDTLEEATLQYQVNSGEEKLSSLGDSGIQAWIVCPLTDDSSSYDKWFLSGETTATKSFDTTDTGSQPCLSEPGRSESWSTHDEGRSTLTIPANEHGSLTLTPLSGKFSWFFTSHASTKTPIHYRRNGIDCDGENQTMEYDHETNEASANLMAIGSFTTGTDTLSVQEENKPCPAPMDMVWTTCGYSTEIQLPTQAVEFHSLGASPPGIFGTIGGKPNQFLPPILDNINMQTQFPSCF